MSRALVIPVSEPAPTMAQRFRIGWPALVFGLVAGFALGLLV